MGVDRALAIGPREVIIEVICPICEEILEEMGKFITTKKIINHYNEKMNLMSRIFFALIF